MDGIDAVSVEVMATPLVTAAHDVRKVAGLSTTSSPSEVTRQKRARLGQKRFTEPTHDDDCFS